MEPERGGPSLEKTSGFQKWIGRIARHPRGVAQGIGFALLAIIVLQNFESTSVDVLFWTVSELPKLVLIFLAMIIGALGWEVLRRTWLR